MDQITLFQTWRTQNLDKKILKLQEKEIIKNPVLNRTIYTDSQMIDSIASNFDKETFKYFQKIKNIVAKADFWRYLILYQHGGVYLDIDSSITGKIDNSFYNSNTGIISLEDNNKLFLQWSLIYSKNHPVLEKVINNIKINLDNNLFKNDISSLTGPKLYTKSILQLLAEHSISLNDLLELNLKTKTTELNLTGGNLIFVPSGIYDELFLFKHKYTHKLLNRKKGILGTDHWTVQQKIHEVY